MRGLTIAALPVVIACGTANAQAWQKIDCGNSRITVPRQVSCWEGPPAQWTARAGPGFSIKFQCVANDGSAYTKAGGMRGFVRYHMQQPGSNAHCFRNEGSN